MRIITMDMRLLIVLTPVLAAGSWALYNIGRVALQQLRSM
uniref:Photosystem II reaction center protein Y n=4 Tax=Halymeniaceae TaxID=31453 RepID=A0A6F8UNK5_9FLOR|nr:photosystem II protein Y [Grateloupia taiwanensis]YP_009488626.1 photosystem II protein Y [Grateloupia filicina]YP_010502352.1 photosystem II protein Y [Grateloupia turuturu]BCB14959.1 photosystem II protein Y [Grateloupia asiatica]AGO19860.1 photosystem II protein Y [Grateloupia taiwanensis]AWD77468.1 photosystem II protein Y [Grateloupia filicina]QHD45221.1 photosystem II protein Y [Grateloupia turuturu]UXC96765.1 photosystem II protein Y [Grateloupia turuturu]